MREEEARIRVWEDRPRLSREQEARFFASIEKADGFFGDDASMRGATEQILRLLEENRSRISPKFARLRAVLNGGEEFPAGFSRHE